MTTQQPSSPYSPGKPITRPSPVAVALVSIYLLAVAAWLVITRQIPSVGLRRILKNATRAPYTGRLDAITPEQGRCFVAPVPDMLLSDAESASRLRLFEDGRELGPAHSGHDDIRRAGGGRYSHWGAQLYFSTSDDSDPRSNGRKYEVREVTR